MKKLFTLFSFAACLLYAQSTNVGINTENPTATLHVNGNMRVQEVADIDYSVIENGFSNQTKYKALYWDPVTKEIFSKTLDQPYVRLNASYKDNEDAQNPATDINLNPNDYFLFLTDVSVRNPKSVSDIYRIGVKSVQGNGRLMPVPGFDLKENGNKYNFKAYYQHPTDGKLFYYYKDNQGENVIDPPSPHEPLWVGSIFAVSKKYMEVLYDVTINYPTYWDRNGGGKYGVELGKLIEENSDATDTVTATIDAKENTEVK